ncbi:MAG: histidine phosphatase family protein [Candidatus Saccharimonadales bacterium]
MNRLASIDKLNNRYFIMRHGQSRANIEEIIVSDPKLGKSSRYGLTDLGKQQAEQAAKNSGLSQNIIIYSSDFSCARQTADIVGRIIGVSEIKTVPALCERNFGK